MNPLVEKMLIAQSEGIDVRTLEQIFEHEAKCQSRSHDNGKVICSEDVAYRLYTCTPAINVCTAMGEDSLACLGTYEYACQDCDRDLEDCWTIRPI